MWPNLVVEVKLVDILRTGNPTRSCQTCIQRQKRKRRNKSAILKKHAPPPKPRAHHPTTNTTDPPPESTWAPALRTTLSKASAPWLATTGQKAKKSRQCTTMASMSATTKASVTRSQLHTHLASPPSRSHLKLQSAQRQLLFELAANCNALSYGIHCTDPWSGSHSSFKSSIIRIS